MGRAPASTIVAPATAAGRAALAVVRLSGPEARSIAADLSSRTDFRPRRATLVDLLDSAGAMLDQAVVTFFPGPASLTGEDVVEISCHGSPVVVETLIERCLEAGAEPARPGEFSRRAFLNGKMDLTQAEAVQDLIGSETLFQARRAGQQLRGELSRRLQPLKQRLIEMAAQLETAVEFVEDDVSPAGREVIAQAFGEVEAELDRLQEGFRTGQLIRHGVRIVLAGPSNAGKSTIFNGLLDTNRAITSPIAGTTRDVLTEAVDLDGLPATLVDTAGWREGVDLLEQEGIVRGEDEIRRADIVVLVVDASLQDAGSLRDTGGVDQVTCVLALNKQDLGERLRLPASLRDAAAAVVPVSGLTGEGLDRLRQALRQAAWPAAGPEVESGLLTRQRHKDAVDRCRRHLGEAGRACREGISEEFVLYDLRGAFEALGEITGEITPDDVLEAVFSTFCIGK